MSKHVDIKTVNIDLGDRSYDVAIGKGLMSILPRLLEPFFRDKKQRRVFIVSDENVWSQYGDLLLGTIRTLDVPYGKCILPAGETAKSWKYIEKLTNSFADADLDRSSLIIAFGGGVVGDAVGFAASIYKRGLDYIQIPTTLMAQVDSSIGGKTGINTDFGKNQVGTFYQPKGVFIDIEFLKTLPQRECFSAISEVVKYGLIGDMSILEGLYKYEPPRGVLGTGEDMVYKDMAYMGSIKNEIDNFDGLLDIIVACVSIKARIIARDEKDEHLRRILNFGHTFGHAIEQKYNYKKYNHGEAVAMGMLIAMQIVQILENEGIDTQLSLEQVGAGLATNSLVTDRIIEDSERESENERQNLKTNAALYQYDTICKIFMKFGFYKNEPILELLQYIKQDKKKSGEDVSLVLLGENSRFFEKKINYDRLEEILIKNIKRIDKFPSRRITPPPSKSLSHRAAIATLLAGGDIKDIRNLAANDDVGASICGLKKIMDASKSNCEYNKKDELIEIDCKESASTLRFLLPIALAFGGSYKFLGSARLIHRVKTDCLYFCKQQGLAHIIEANSIEVRGAIKARDFDCRGLESSQLLTGLLFSAPLLGGDSDVLITINKPSPYLDLTIDVMEKFGIEIKQKYIIARGQKYVPCKYAAEADWSSAAVFLVYKEMARGLGSEIKIEGLDENSLQGDRKIMEIIGKYRQYNSGDRLAIDAKDILDIVPIICVLASCRPVETRIINIARLRGKESDRIFAICTELQKLGVLIYEDENKKENKNSIVIYGRDIKISNMGELDIDKGYAGGIEVYSHHDHRIAMALSLMSAVCKLPISIIDSECVKKSYPNFYEDFCKEEKR